MSESNMMKALNVKIKELQTEIATMHALKMTANLHYDNDQQQYRNELIDFIQNRGKWVRLD